MEDFFSSSMMTFFVLRRTPTHTSPIKILGEVSRRRQRKTKKVLMEDEHKSSMIFIIPLFL